MKLNFKILDNRIGTEFDMPKYQTSGSAGMDLIACNEEKLLLKPNESTVIQSGISIYIEDPEFAGIIIPRSGLGAKKGLVCGTVSYTHLRAHETS